jgi:hypothetical protein
MGAGRAADRLRARVRSGPLHDGLVDMSARARLLFHRARRALGGGGAAGDLAARFAAIHERVTCAHSLAESLCVLEMALASRHVPGSIVECGVFKGGMTTKLSVLAAHLGRPLYAYDSYGGLPDPVRYGTGEQVETYARKMERGDTYRGGLAEVRAAVTAYGDPRPCVFVKGWFKDSFARPDVDPTPIAVAFVDVDLTLSLRECLEFLVPRLAPGGLLFCHEARDPEIVREITDAGLLRHEHAGVGTGLGDDRPNLCWIRKTADAAR